MILTTRYFKFFRTFRVMKTCMAKEAFLYGKGYICNRVLTGSPHNDDSMLILAQQIEPCLHKQGTF